MLVIQSGAKIVFTKFAGYNWFFNKKSVSNTHHNNSTNLNDFITLLNICNQKLRNISNRDLALEEYFFIRFIYWYLLFSFRNSNNYEIENAVKSLTTWLNSKYPNHKNNSYLNSFNLSGEKLVFRVIIWILIILTKLNLLKHLLILVSKFQLFKNIHR